MIITPLQLWKDYDRKSQPLNGSVISKTVKSDRIVRYVYFNGDAKEGGMTRIYGKLYEPVTPVSASDTEKVPANAVLVMDDPENGVDIFDPSQFLSEGLAVFVVDYAGETENSPRYTMYPKAIAFANYFQREKGFLREAPSEAKESCRYVWSTVALRAITFLENEGYGKIAMLGIGDGGHQVFPTAYIASALTAAAIQFSGTLVKEQEKALTENVANEVDNSMISYKAALSEAAYAPFLKAPIFFQLTSNEQNSSFDEMNTIFNACNDDNALMAVSELSDRTVSHLQERNVVNFFLRCFEGKALPRTPKLTAKASGKSLYLNIAALGEQTKETLEGMAADNRMPETYTGDDIESVRLYVAHCQKISAYRNWNNHIIENIGEGEYLAKVSVFAANEPLYSFVNVRFKDGFEISSQLLAVTPAIWGVEPVPFQPKRRIYDSDMGTGEWLAMGSGTDGKKGSPEVCEGAFNILGVTAKNTKRLATFVLADRRYVGAEDAHLQLIVNSPVNQTLTFSITSSNGFAKFMCERQIRADDNWKKFTLTPSDFKSAEKNFDEWKKVIIFEIAGEDEFLVNSLLWV